jgi:hypothetical protein
MLAAVQKKSKAEGNRQLRLNSRSRRHQSVNFGIAALTHGVFSAKHGRKMRLCR